MNLLDHSDLLEIRKRIGQLLQLVDQCQAYVYRAVEEVSTSGSQGAEFRVLERLLSHYQTGSYVEVGVYGAEDCSNTWGFYQKGWRGLLIEPLHTCWERILKKRPGDYLWPTAAGSYNGAARLNIYGPSSSFREGWGEPGEKRVIEVETLATILSRFPAIRDNCKLCSIDVEGWESNVLAGIDWTTFRPDFFVIEYVTMGTPRCPPTDLSGEWRQILEENNYTEIWHNDLNIIFQAK